MPDGNAGESADLLCGLCACHVNDTDNSRKHKTTYSVAARAVRVQCVQCIYANEVVLRILRREDGAAWGQSKEALQVAQEEADHSGLSKEHRLFRQ